VGLRRIARPIREVYNQIRMSDLIQITTTTGTRDTADRIALELVERGLAACVQVAGPITSTFRWQGKVETAEEWLCIAKSSQRQLPAIEKLLADLHPYEVPELIATPITSGGAAYLKWLGEQLQPSTLNSQL
jgi:periplasmic divalent cation tolerance protein